jgi:enoyl-[acyl-carrier-protein] reductase (NADH)
VRRSTGRGGYAIAAGCPAAGVSVVVNGRGQERVQDTVECLRSDLASATTGGALRVDGGYVDAILP